ncbi:MAG: radical SAM protein, partial [Acidobacteriota bacterium]
MTCPGKLLVTANGCPENRLDAARVLASLVSDGWVPTDDCRQADLVVLSMCGLTGEEEARSRFFLDHLDSNRKPGARVVACGCLAASCQFRDGQTGRDSLFGADQVGDLLSALRPDGSSAVRPAHQLAPVLRLPQSARWNIPRPKNRERRQYAIESLLRYYRDCFDRRTAPLGRRTFCLEIATGCLGNCSYCSTRQARGVLRSKPVAEVLGELEGGLERGHQDIALLGTEVGCYGHDHGADLCVLLAEILARCGDWRLRLRNVHPLHLARLLPGLLPFLRAGKVSVISTALQSGSDRVLEAMRRGYNAASFVRSVRAIKREAPEVRIRTPVMVGFPTETEAEFA